MSVLLESKFAFGTQSEAKQEYRHRYPIARKCQKVFQVVKHKACPERLHFVCETKCVCVLCYFN